MSFEVARNHVETSDSEFRFDIISVIVMVSGPLYVSEPV